MFTVGGSSGSAGAFSAPGVRDGGEGSARFNGAAALFSATGDETAGEEAGETGAGETFAGAAAVADALVFPFFFDL